MKTNTHLLALIIVLVAVAAVAAQILWGDAVVVLADDTIVWGE